MMQSRGSVTTRRPLGGTAIPHATPTKLAPAPRPKQTTSSPAPQPTTVLSTSTMASKMTASPVRSVSASQFDNYDRPLEATLECPYPTFDFGNLEKRAQVDSNDHGVNSQPPAAADAAEVPVEFNFTVEGDPDEVISNMKKKEAELQQLTAAAAKPAHPPRPSDSEPPKQLVTVTAAPKLEFDDTSDSGLDLPPPLPQAAPRKVMAKTTPPTAPIEVPPPAALTAVEPDSDLLVPQVPPSSSVMTAATVDVRFINSGTGDVYTARVSTAPGAPAVTVTVGRSPRCDLIVKIPAKLTAAQTLVSRNQCAVELLHVRRPTGGGVLTMKLTDTSSNGTFVNGMKVLAKSIALQPSDALCLIDTGKPGAQGLDATAFTWTVVVPSDVLTRFPDAPIAAPPPEPQPAASVPTPVTTPPEAPSLQLVESSGDFKPISPNNNNTTNKPATAVTTPTPKSSTSLTAKNLSALPGSERARSPEPDARSTRSSVRYGPDGRRIVTEKSPSVGPSPERADGTGSASSPPPQQQNAPAAPVQTRKHSGSITRFNVSLTSLPGRGPGPLSSTPRGAAPTAGMNAQPSGIESGTISPRATTPLRRAMSMSFGQTVGELTLEPDLVAPPELAPPTGLDAALIERLQSNFLTLVAESIEMASQQHAAIGDAFADASTALVRHTVEFATSALSRLEMELEPLSEGPSLALRQAEATLRLLSLPSAFDVSSPARDDHTEAALPSPVPKLNLSQTGLGAASDAPSPASDSFAEALALAAAEKRSQPATARAAADGRPRAPVAVVPPALRSPKLPWQGIATSSAAPKPTHAPRSASGALLKSPRGTHTLIEELANPIEHHEAMQAFLTRVKQREAYWKTFAHRHMMERQSIQAKLEKVAADIALNKHLTDDLKSATTVIEALKAENEGLLSSKSKLEKKLAALRTHCDGLQSDITSKSEALSSAQATIDQLNAALSEAVAVGEQAAERFLEMDADKDQQLAALAAQVDAHASITSQLEERLHAAQEAAEGTAVERDAKMIELTAASAALQASRDEMARLDAALKLWTERQFNTASTQTAGDFVVKPRVEDLHQQLALVEGVEMIQRLQIMLAATSPLPMLFAVPHCQDADGELATIVVESSPKAAPTTTPLSAHLVAAALVGDDDDVSTQRSSVLPALRPPATSHTSARRASVRPDQHHQVPLASAAPTAATAQLRRIAGLVKDVKASFPVTVDWFSEKQALTQRRLDAAIATSERAKKEHEAAEVRVKQGLEELHHMSIDLVACRAEQAAMERRIAAEVDRLADSQKALQTAQAEAVELRQHVVALADQLRDANQKSLALEQAAASPGTLSRRREGSPDQKKPSSPIGGHRTAVAVSDVRPAPPLTFTMATQTYSAEGIGQHPGRGSSAGAVSLASLGHALQKVLTPPRTPRGGGRSGPGVDSPAVEQPRSGPLLDEEREDMLRVIKELSEALAGTTAVARHLELEVSALREGMREPAPTCERWTQLCVEHAPLQRWEPVHKPSAKRYADASEGTEGDAQERRVAERLAASARRPVDDLATDAHRSPSRELSPARTRSAGAHRTAGSPGRSASPDGANRLSIARADEDDASLQLLASDATRRHLAMLSSALRRADNPRLAQGLRTELQGYHAKLLPTASRVLTLEEIAAAASLPRPPSPTARDTSPSPTRTGALGRATPSSRKVQYHHHHHHASSPPSAAAPHKSNTLPPPRPVTGSAVKGVSSAFHMS